MELRHSREAEYPGGFWFVWVVKDMDSRLRGNDGLAGQTGRQGRRVALDTKTYVVIPAQAGIQMASGLPRALLPLFARCADLQ
jgi:hypothetical protein